MTRVDPWGIEDSYQDSGGKRQVAPVETARKLRDAMQPEGRSEPEEPNLLFAAQGEPSPLSRPSVLHLEDGAELRVENQLPRDLPIGYHSLRDLKSGKERRLIVAPRRCYHRAGPSIWGWALQLYSLRSQQSCGMGDFADLRDFARWAVEHGAGVVMTNPLNAASPGTPQQASPYSPTSRIYRNLLYLRIDDVPGAREHAGDRNPLAHDALQLNQLPTIDRDAIYKAKLEALDKIWQATRSRIDISEFEREQGALLDYFASYCVLAEQHGSNWRRWPEQLRRPDTALSEVTSGANQDRLRFHKWIQYLLEQQLANVSTTPVIMQDLPIGVDPNGADAWIWQDLFAQGVSVGAPPDLFNTQGQDWGLQPYIPHKLRAANYEPFVKIIRNTMRHSTGLRIDHVMGLFRLFWIPSGVERKKGAYVRYHHDEMLSIVALESVRANAFVVGEDLGTVEDSVRETLSERGVLSYRVMWFEKEMPGKYPRVALAAVTTHDLPTIAGLWSGADLREQQDLGLQPNVEGTKETRELLKRVTGADEGAAVEQVIEKAYGALAQAPSEVLIVAIEDALAMKTRPNLPGTLGDARPNWGIPLPKEFEEITTDPLVQRVAAVMNHGQSAAKTGSAITAIEKP